MTLNASEKLRQVALCTALITVLCGLYAVQAYATIRRPTPTPTAVPWSKPWDGRPEEGIIVPLDDDEFRKIEM